MINIKEIIDSLTKEIKDLDNESTKFSNYINSVQYFVKKTFLNIQLSYALSYRIKLLDNRHKEHKQLLLKEEREKRRILKEAYKYWLYDVEDNDLRKMFKTLYPIDKFIYEEK